MDYLEENPVELEWQNVFEMISHVGDFYDYIPKRCVPCWCLPGSPKKLALIAERAEAGVDLYHPDDATTEQKRAERLQQIARDAFPFLS